MTDPNMVFSTDPRHGLVARSGWEQEEARTVLRDLGWEWAEELHALVPPDDVPEADAGLEAVEELHLHGHRTGYAVGPYGTMRLTLDRAEQVFTKAVASNASETRPGGQPAGAERRRPVYGGELAPEELTAPQGPESPAI
ncbi:hypothetical protein [Streptomyces sp. SID3915]|uniref:hypothetical protein n=1 Tax=Streptomyces sp. SID3915 TaxID=2690263 RepID=UPI001F44E8CD|nr:hypothetical protein [Streptomyces sp. SID3915]